jgi:hypothetical protein
MTDIRELTAAEVDLICGGAQYLGHSGGGHDQADNVKGSANAIAAGADAAAAVAAVFAAPVGSIIGAVSDSTSIPFNIPL